MILKVLLFQLLISAVSHSQNLGKTNPEYMLPKNVKPLRYNLTIVPNFSTNTFKGTVVIQIEAIKTSNYITLHASNLNMPHKETIIVQDAMTGQNLIVSSANASNLTYDYFTISLSEMLVKNRIYILTLPNFYANFSKSPVGFASGTFQDVDGSTRYYAYTHFEPCDARRAFPCFDEPGLRAKFNIRLVRPKEHFISASNSRLISHSVSNPFEDIYEETIDMPTYLVAFTISEMKFSEALDIYRIIARPEAINNNEHIYALQITVDAIHFMETFTNVSFTLPKLDQMAIKAFPSAMENWGLIVYGEPYLLLTNEEDKPSILTTVAHEVSHQWFGNLIGITWWEYIWLNEGFANYFENLIPVLIEPNIDSRGNFIKSLQSVFKVDMVIDTRPLTQNADIPTKIPCLFDRISYDKAGAVIHMLEHSLTKPVFQQGIRYYTKKMKFGLATSASLYKSLQKAVDENGNNLPGSLKVANFMSTWELVEGFPVVFVRRTYGNNNNVITLSQKRYTSNPKYEIGKWIIPINFASSSNPSFEDTKPDYWMTDTENTISASFLNDNDWLIANKKETGYYRVNYDKTNWELITQALLTNHLDIDVLNRAQLIDDSINLAETEQLGYDITTKLVEYIKNEKEVIPWQSYKSNAFRMAASFTILQITRYSKLMQLEDKIALDEIIKTVMNSGQEGLHAAVTFVVDNFAYIEQKLNRKSGLMFNEISELISTDYHLNILKQATSASTDADFYTRLFKNTKINIARRKQQSNRLAKNLILLV